MIIESIHIKNFRSILDEVLHCENLTVLVGTNGAGKSSFLRGLDLFYNASPKIEPEDFYNEDTTKELSVAVTFKDLSGDAKKLFAIYIQGDKLTVERVFTCVDKAISWKYHGASLQNPAFQAIRDAMNIKDKAKSAKEAYAIIKEMSEYNSLPAWSKLDTAQSSLKQWETEHPSACMRQRDDGQFFVFKEVGQGYLGRFTRFLFIPAVRDASNDTAEGRGSVLTVLMDLVVRSVLANKESLKKLKEETQKQYEEILDPAKLTELSVLAEDMTKTLKTFVPDTKIDLQWLPLSEVEIPLPQAIVKLAEDGYSSAVGRTGHGLQRAFILTLLQHLALAQTKFVIPEVTPDGQKESLGDLKLPNLVIVIEEPELYQHPGRQRHLAKILLQLAIGKTPGVAEKTQIIYATHSPLFVGIDRVDQIRLLKKVSYAIDKPKITKIISTTLEKVAEALWEADGKISEKYTKETLFPRLQTIMTPWMNEGFFADVAVLVEGEGDRAAILGAAKVLGHDLESKGYCIIPCGGKTSIDRPAVIFKQLGVPVYIIWDSDKEEGKARKEDNHRLLRLIGQPIVDWPSQVHDEFSCFENKLETTLCKEIGNEEFERHLVKCQSDFCITKREHAMKNPKVIETIIQEAHKKSCKCNTLDSIVEKIILCKK